MAISKKRLYERYLARLKPLLSSSPNQEITDHLANAKTTVLRMSRYESSAFDTSWIDKVEETILDLGEIISNPRIITQEEGNLTPIELAKKTKSESVQHLASHTQYIKSIEEDGSVVPSKIISFVNEDFLFTYENRFIATLIRRLMLFIEKRYEFVQAYLPLHQESVMLVRTKTKIGDEEVEIETRIKSRSLSGDESAAKAEEVSRRIIALREFITYYYTSPFMRKMKTEHDVRKPIILTNILRKNLKYHKCYELFVFLERYDSFGMNYNADERYFSLTEEQLREFALVQLGEYYALQDGHEYDVIRNKVHSYKPKFLTSIDDEQFVFGELPKGPIQFVRVDEEYRQYLQSTIRTDIPSRPNKYEKAYYADDIDYRREARAEEKAIDQLIRRKAHAAARFEKTIKGLIAKREEEEKLLFSMEEQERLEGEEALLERKREEIRLAAENFNAPKPIDSWEGEDEGSSLFTKQEEEPEEEPIVEAVEEEPIPAEEDSIEKPIEEARVEEPKEEEPAEDAVEEPAPVEEPVEEESAPVEEPIEEEPAPAEKYFAPAEEPSEEEPEVVLKDEEEAPVAEPAIEEQPVEEAPVEETAASEEQIAEAIEEAPAEEEPIVEEPAKDQPVVEESKEEAPAPVEPAKEEKKPAAKKVKPLKEPKKKQEKPVKEKKKPAPKEEEPEEALNEEEIYGRFVVKTNEGYYVKDGVFARSKNAAYVFNDFVKARQTKIRYGGKVVKL